MKAFSLFIILFFAVTLPIYATHLFGGEIQATKIKGQNYKITVKLYLDNASGGTSSNGLNQVKVCFGDGEVSDFSATGDSPSIEGVTIRTFEGLHTYSSPGTFQISVALADRSTDIINLSKSQPSSQFLWLVVDTKLENSTPIFKDFPVQAGVRQAFTMDLNPLNAESDSMSYKIAHISKPSPGTCGVRMSMSDDLYPNDISKSGRFYINKENFLNWTAPEIKGKYIFAVVAYEWRDGVKISETYREVLIIVDDLPGEYIEIPAYVNADNLTPNTITGSQNGSSEIALTVSAYPVPTMDKVTVKANTGLRQNITIQLLDLSGRVLAAYLSEPTFTFEQVVDLTNFSPGLYIISAKTNHETASKKIVKK